MGAGRIKGNISVDIVEELLYNFVRIGILRA